MTNVIVISIISLLPLAAFAQLGGKQSFDFLNVPNNARLAALGGVNVSSADQDINLFYSNPALVGDTLNRWASVSYQAYVADVSQTTFSYAHTFRKVGMIAFGVQHIGYGTVKGYDPMGMETGDFKSGETAIVVSKYHTVNNFRFGTNVKAVFSSLAGYRANALMVDLGGTFIHPKKNLTVGLMMKNMGFVLSRYTEDSPINLPYDLQLGATFKPEHMPFRFSLTAYNLARTNVTYYNPQSSLDKPGTLDKVLRRFNFATEVLIHKKVNLLIAYNYRIHQELKLAEGGGGAGISLGLSLRIKAFEFTLSRSGYVAGSSAAYAFTLSANTQKFLSRR